MKKIKRPDWRRVMRIKSIASESLDYWYDEFVEPVNEMLDKAVMVYCTEVEFKPEGNVGWSASEKKEKYATHRAYMINIEPIKHESCADVLRDIIQLKHITHYEHQLVERARAALKRES